MIDSDNVLLLRRRGWIGLRRGDRAAPAARRDLSIRKRWSWSRLTRW